jgi:hypothetical protein
MKDNAQTAAITTGVPLHHHHPDHHETAWRAP